MSRLLGTFLVATALFISFTSGDAQAQKGKGNFQGGGGGKGGPPGGQNAQGGGQGGQDKKGGGQGGQGGQQGGGGPEQLFKQLDTNGDGKLSKDEVLQLANQIPDQQQAAKARLVLAAIYDQLNAGGNGLDLNQFQGMKKGGGGGGQNQKGGKK